MTSPTRARAGPRALAAVAVTCCGAALVANGSGAARSETATVPKSQLDAARAWADARVSADPRLATQRVRLGRLVVSSRGVVRYHKLRSLMAQIPRARCRPADRRVQPGRGGETEHIVLFERREHLSVYVGSIADVDCADSNPLILLMAAEWLAIRSPRTGVSTPLGELRVGSRVNARLARLAVSRIEGGVRVLLWPLSSHCSPATAAPLEPRWYFMRVALRGATVAAIDIRTGILETGECPGG